MKLGDFVVLQRGTTYKSRLLGEEGRVLLGLSTIQRNGGFRMDSLKRYAGESPEKICVRPGELFVALKDVTQSADLLGAVARVPEEVGVGRLTQDTVKLAFSGAPVLPSFIHWVLRTPHYRSYCREHALGTTNLSLSREDFLAFPVPAMTDDRLALVELLDTLDNKITVNERIAATADELAGKVFQQAVLQSPASFTEQALSHTAEFINGRAFTKHATGTGRMVIRIAEINSGPGNSTVYNAIEVPDKHLARPGDVLFAWSGSLTVARWYRPEAIINQHIFKCVPRNGYPKWLISQLVHRKIDDFRAIAADKATTMGHIQRKHLDEPVLVPTADALPSLDAKLGPLWERALVAEQEALSLAPLRDALLPQLMSGRLRIKDAEKIVEDAT